MYKKRIVTTKFAVPLRERERRAIQRYVNRTGVKKGALVRRALVEFLDRLKAEERDGKTGGSDGQDRA